MVLFKTFSKRLVANAFRPALLPLPSTTTMVRVLAKIIAREIGVFDKLWR